MACKAVRRSLCGVASTCTGEKTIGFYDKGFKKLVYSELAGREADINEFYRKYGVERSVLKMRNA